MWAGASPNHNCHHCPIRCKVVSQVIEAEDLRFWSKLILFDLSVCSPLCQHQHSHPRGEQCWRKKYLVRELSMCQDIGFGPPARVGNPDCLWCTVCLSACNGYPHPVQMLLQIWISFIFDSWALSLASASLILVWSWTTEPVRPVWVLPVRWGTDYGSLASGRDGAASDELPV